jgi:hypothetical protein
MSEKIETEVTVVDWDVTEYHGKFVQLSGYNRDGDEVVRRHYELDPRGTQVKHEGEWVDLNDIDDGGFPNEAVFTAWTEE